MKKFFALSFIPLSPALGLLALRVIFGGAMLALHGWPKLIGFGSMFHTFPDPLGVTSEVSYGLTVASEFLAAGLIVVGWFTRFAALSLVITMGVAFFVVHGGALSGEGSGEMAMVYGAAFLVLVLTGSGRHSLDARNGRA